MIKLYTWTTPNGRKVSIMLEELGLEYQVHPINLAKQQQFSPEFLAISPNNKIPAIVDEDGPGGALTIFESGAILTYLAERSGRFLAPSGPARYKALEWLFWQMGGVGPMFGQLGYFAMRAEPKSPLATQRFSEESERLLIVLEQRLASVPYLAGADYSVADMAVYPWLAAVSNYLQPVLGDSLAAKPAIQSWLLRVGERPAVKRGMAVPTLAG